MNSLSLKIFIFKISNQINLFFNFFLLSINSVALKEKMENQVKRLCLENVDLENEEELMKYAADQEYIQPLRQKLNRRLIEDYKLPPGSERIILDEFHRRCTEKHKFLPSSKSDTFYWHLRSKIIENVDDINNSKDINKKLNCKELKFQQQIIRNLLKENVVLIEKMLAWKHEFFKNYTIEDQKKLFQFNTLFKFFVVRRKEIHKKLGLLNNLIAQIILRAEESKIYLKRSVKMLDEMYEYEDE